MTRTISHFFQTLKNQNWRVACAVATAAMIGLHQPSQSMAQTSVPASPGNTSDLQVWQRAQAADTPDAYQAYLTRFPNGAFATLATQRASTPLLSDMMPVPPRPDNAEVQVEMAAARTAWDNAAWARVKAANTHAAYREYLLHLPVGEHADEALAAYRASQTVLALPRVEECTLEDREAGRSEGEPLKLKYPDFAIERWTGGIFIGRSIIDYSGRVLGSELIYSTNPSMFSEQARLSAAKPLYQPARQNCAHVPSMIGLVFQYTVGDLPYESRPNNAGSPTQIGLNQLLRGRLDDQNAQLFSFTPMSGVSVYEIEFKSRFPHLLTHLIDQPDRPTPLVNNKLFVTVNDKPIVLRVSAPDMPNSRRKNMGPFQMTIRQVFNQPDSRGVSWSKALDPDLEDDGGGEEDD
jgi:hypothetical protein